MNTKILFLVIAAAMLVVLPLSVANAQQIQQGYGPRGVITGTAAAAVTTTVFMDGADSIQVILTASGGNFNSTTLNVDVSIDGTNFVRADTLSLGTETSFGTVYSASNLSNSTATPINVADFPYVKLTTSAGVGSVTEKITYSAR